MKQGLGAAVDDFQLATINGEKTSLEAFLNSNKGVAVVFWSGICSHCVRYDQYLNTFAGQHPELGLLAVASRQGETLDRIRASVAQRKLTFPSLPIAAGSLPPRRSWRRPP